jgi:hypothetical protein
MTGAAATVASKSRARTNGKALFLSLLLFLLFAILTVEGSSIKLIRIYLKELSDAPLLNITTYYKWCY